MNSVMKNKKEEFRDFILEHEPMFFARFRYKIGDIRSKVKNFVQRGRRGWCDADWWNMDLWFIETASALLKQLEEKGHGYPDCDEATSTFEGWKEVLGEMQYCLAHMNPDEMYDDDIDVSDIAAVEAVDREAEENKERFFELFSKYFYHLWD